MVDSIKDQLGCRRVTSLGQPDEPPRYRVSI
jgi:hypothetical protein